MKYAVLILLSLLFISGMARSVSAQEGGLLSTDSGGVVEWQQEELEIPDEVVVEGVVEEVYREEVTVIDEGRQQIDQELKVLITSGEMKGESVVVPHQRILGKGERVLEPGDKIVVSINDTGTGEYFYYVVDYVRREVLYGLFGVFVVLVLLVSQKHGIRSLAGLVASFGIIFGVILPALQTGYDPILVAVGGAVLIIGVTFFLTHGFNEKTVWAALGTVAALSVTALIAQVVMNMAQLSGFGSEEAMFLQVVKSGGLNMYGLFLAGVIIGALGVLDDITISQASVVQELKRANPKLPTKKLFTGAMNVGRDHIASLVNTLILVYTGSALPLLLLFMLDSSRNFAVVLNYSMVAEEIVRVLTGSIGIVLAVPLTTFMASKWGFKKLEV